MPELYFFGGIPALVTAAINPKCKRLSDLVAGTYVIRDRASVPPSRHIAMPPELAEWATSADFAPMPPTLATGIRGFLDRYDVHAAGAGGHRPAAGPTGCRLRSTATAANVAARTCARSDRRRTIPA